LNNEVRLQQMTLSPESLYANVEVDDCAILVVSLACNAPIHVVDRLDDIAGCFSFNVPASMIRDTIDPSAGRLAFGEGRAMETRLI
jgi:hypothetical protein